MSMTGSFNGVPGDDHDSIPPPPSKRLRHDDYNDNDVVGPTTAAVEHSKRHQNNDHTLRSSSLSSPTLQLTGHTGSVYALEYSPNGDTLCSASFDKTCLLWNHRQGDYHNDNVLSGGHKNAILDCKWLDDEHIVTCSADKTIQLWDANTGQRMKKWKDHTGIVNAVSTTPRPSSSSTSTGASSFASVSDDGTCRLWDIRSKRPTTTLETEYPILAVALSSGDSTSNAAVYTAGIDNLIHCWDIKMARKAYSLKGHTDTVTCLSLHPQGTHLLSNSMDHTLRTWDIRPYCVGNKRHCKTFLGHKHNAEKGLLKCAWSPSSGQLVTCGSGDRMVHIWDEFSTQELYLLPGHKGCVNACTFHPTENVIASGGSDKQIFVGELS